MVRFYASAGSALLMFTAFTTVTALPLSVPDFDAINITQRAIEVYTRAPATSKPQYNRDNVKDWCNHPFSDTDRTVGEEIWYRSASGLFLDVWVHTPDPKVNNKYKDWVRRMDQNAFKKSQSSSWDCATIGGTCGHAADCHNFFEAGAKPQFYIMYSVEKAHATFMYFHERLQNNAILDNLQMNDLIKDMGANPSGVNPWGAISGAFGVASGLLGATPGAGPYGAAMGVVSGAFGIAAANFKPADPKATLQAMIADYFKKSEEAIQQTLRNLFGEGDPNAIPRSAQTGDWMTNVARYFDGGKFLINSVDMVYKGLIDKGTELFRQAMTLRLLSSRGFYIAIETDIKKEKDCLEKYQLQSKPSRIWRSNMCWTIYGPSERDLSNTYPINYGRKNLEKDIVDKLKNKYKMDLQFVYQIAWDCKKARGNKDREIDAGSVPYNGLLPTCFFNMDVVKGSFLPSTGKYHEEPL